MNVTLGTQPIPIPDLTSSSRTESGLSGFSNAIENAISQVEQSRTQANATAANLLGSGQGDVYQVALAGQRADLSFELFLQVRNKLVSAYQEVMKLQM